MLHLRLGKLLHLALNFITFMFVLHLALICVPFTVGIKFSVVITFNGDTTTYHLKYSILVVQHFRVIYHGISHVSLVFSSYTPEPLGYEKAVHNYFIPCHRKYRGQNIANLGRE